MYLMDSINWLGHASFFFTDKNGNKIYFIDPFKLQDSSLKAADIIFITHAHSDHFSPEDIAKIINSKTIIIAPIDILEKIDIENSRKIKIEPNKEYDVKGFKFSTIPAYNNNSQRLSFHPKENNWVGIFLI